MTQHTVDGSMVVQTYLEVGNSAQAAGKYEMAEKMYRAALQETQRDDHKNSTPPLVLYQVASMLARRGRVARAERLFKRAMVQMDALYGNENPLKVLFLLRIIEVFIPQGKFRVAVNTYKHTRLLLKVDGEVPVYELEAVLLRIAKQWHLQSKTYIAMEVYKDIIELRRRQAEPDQLPSRK